ncbi:Ig-like domain-containing protein [Desulfitobacterium sp. Sab5]|uniref:Ig-like domain-containing protein n=1 Tax=Desulfitobacterium nosdiversum TaxID=3375356 RepID=UPI003CF13A69
MMKSKLRSKMESFTRVVLFSVISALFLISPLTALAEGGNGSGGQQNPLSLVSSSPADGQKDVKNPVEIKLVFNKNVVNMSVKDKNQKCITLTDSEGKTIPVQMIMADDQIDPTKNEEIVLKPSQDLKPGTTYQVKITGDLQAKNGMTLGKETSIHFAIADSNITPAKETSVNNPTAGTTANSLGKGSMNKSIIFAVIALIIVGAGYAYYRRRPRQ